MLTRLAFGYRVTRPPLKNVNTRSLKQFRREVHEARRRAHLDAVAYQNAIEDDFLERHRQKTAKLHFKNQCQFRATVARVSYALYQQQEKQQQANQDRLDRLQKYVHDLEIKKLNRIRIKKILEYESQNYWLHEENINEKSISQNVLPEYIGSTEYYHKLHSEAIAYDSLDFDMLHRVSSNEDTVKEKNRLLIPIYKEFLVLIRQVKFTQLERLQKDYQILLNQIEMQGRGEAAMEEARQKFEQDVEQLKAAFRNPQSKKSYIKQKTKDLIFMLKKWKEYTDVLSLTSSEILRIISEKDMEPKVMAAKKNLQQEASKKKEEAFVDPVEEDTEEEEITLEEYLVKNEVKNNVANDIKQDTNLQLESLLNEQEGIFEMMNEQLNESEELERRLMEAQPNTTMGLVGKTEKLSLDIDEGFLKASETTSSIEALKEEYREDKEMLELLNLAGQMTIQYPKLFREVWDRQFL